MNQARESRSLAKRPTSSVVMAGLVPAIHAAVQTTGVDDFIPSFMHEFVEIPQSKLRLHRVDGRDKPGHDGEGGAL